MMIIINSYILYEIYYVKINSFLLASLYYSGGKITKIKIITTVEGTTTTSQTVAPT